MERGEDRIGPTRRKESILPCSAEAAAAAAAFTGCRRTAACRISIGLGAGPPIDVATSSQTIGGMGEEILDLLRLCRRRPSSPTAPPSEAPHTQQPSAAPSVGVSAAPSPLPTAAPSSLPTAAPADRRASPRTMPTNSCTGLISVRRPPRTSTARAWLGQPPHAAAEALLTLFCRFGTRGSPLDRTVQQRHRRNPGSDDTNDAD
jgi:hypothetical protein